MKTLLVVMLFFSDFWICLATNPDSATNASKKASFVHGEELMYSMRYGPIHGGNASIQLSMTRLNNKPVYHARAEAKSVGITDLLFRIEDIYESYFDPVSCLPYKAVRNVSEGSYKYYNEVYFDQDKNLAVSQKSGKISVPKGILDMVSSLYYVRNMQLDTLKKGDTIQITTYFGDEIFPFPLRYRGKENVKTSLGKYHCYRFDPVVEVGRIFSSPDDMSVWISADNNCVPIRVKFDLIVGSVCCDLVGYKNLAYKLKTVE